ncbi:MAG: 2,3-bisphosphoglycerate-independent phosphoglycerate mutase [Promethearchaeota archaeon]
MNDKKALLVILDGVGDRPIPKFGNKTPLQEARKPNLDALAKMGSCGIMDVVAPGTPIGSDLAHLVLFGYDPQLDYPGRGPLEALGVGMKLDPGDVAFRGNFANIDQNFVIVDRRAGRKIPEADEIVDLLNSIKLKDFPDVSIRFKHSTEQRVVCVLRGKNLGHDVSDTNPNKNYVPVKNCKALKDTEENSKTARIINTLSRKIYELLKDHPINQERKRLNKPLINEILFHGPGIIKKVPSLLDKYNLKVACVTGNGLIKGLSMYLGMDVLQCKGATGTINTNLDEKISVALDALKHNDLVFIHVKATDSTGHDNKPELKKLFIEDVDSILFSRILSDVDLNHTSVFVTGDHSTPCSVGDHSGDPVPVLMTGQNSIPDDVTTFDEVNCAEGYLSRMHGSYFFRIILNRLGKLKKYGA